MSDSIDTRINDTRDGDLPSSMHCTYSDGPDKANMSDAIMFKIQYIFNCTITYSTKSDITLSLPYGEWGSVDTKLESKLISKRKQNSLHGLSVTAQHITK